MNKEKEVIVYFYDGNYTTPKHYFGVDLIETNQNSLFLWASSDTKSKDKMIAGFPDGNWQGFERRINKTQMAATGPQGYTGSNVSGGIYYEGELTEVDLALESESVEPIIKDSDHQEDPLIESF